MNIYKKIFAQKFSTRGTVLIEFLLTIALAGTLVPFIYSYHNRAITRAENVKITRQMERIQSVLERYIVENKERMMTTVGRNIIKIDLADLVDYGLDPDFAAGVSEKYQVRILKSVDTRDQASLQGIIVLHDSDITSLRTRQIVSMGDDKLGFVDGNRAYGGFGTWRASIAELGIDGTSGIVRTTGINRDSALYLWRVPSSNVSDATMMSALNLGGRDIKDASFVNTGGLKLDEIFDAKKIVTNDLIFQNRTTIDSEYKTTTAIVSGTLSGDSKNVSVNGTFFLNDLGKFSGFTADNLWVNTLSLSGLSVKSGGAAVLRTGGLLDMTEGRITAMFVTVGFTGSITSRLGVKDKIVDSINSDYYWNVQSRIANLADISSPTLSDMATRALRRESVSGSISTQVFGAVATNKNATMADFMNAINEIQSKVRAKYHMLNLQ